MKIVHLDDLPEMRFPTGRSTRVLVGKDSPLQAAAFVTGRVRIAPRGSIPMHVHGNEEVYHVLAGEGVMTIGDERSNVSAGDTVLIDSDAPHSLANSGESDIDLVFVYAPAGIVSHWEEELRKNPQEVREKYGP